MRNDPQAGSSLLRHHFLDRNGPSLILFIALIMGLFTWIADAALDYFVFYESGFLELLLLNPPQHEIYIRFLILLFFLGFGGIVAEVVLNLRNTRNELQNKETNLRTTLQSIGDAVIATDTSGRIRRMNEQSESLTGWDLHEAQGLLLEQVFRIINAISRKPVANPVQRVLEQGTVQGLANHTVLIAKDGREYQIADSASPIRNDEGSITGVVLVFRDVTEQYRQEELLWKQRRRLANVVEGTDAGIWERNIQTLELFFDVSWLQHLGYDPDAFSEMDLYSWRELLHPEDLEKSDRFIADHLSGRLDVYECEIRVRRRDGSWAWVLDRGKVTERTSDGEPLLLSGTVQDITERKRNVEALQESQRQLATLMGNLPGMAYRCLNDPYWTMLFVSEGCLGLTGYSVEDLIENRTRCYADLINPADEDKVWKKVQQGLEQSGSFEVEYRIITAEGKEKHVWEQGTYVYEEEGLQFLEGFITDITDRKQAEEAIENERTYLSAVIDNIEEAIVICDAEGRIVRFNETARRLHGLPEQPIPSDQWAEYYDLYQEDGVTLLPKEDIPLFRALQGERVFNAEIVVAPKHSRPYNLVCSGQALIDGTGTLFGAVVTMHDITERKQMEKKLREMSLKDSLTALYNRNFFEEEMKRLSDGRYNPLGVIVCDLDGLKFVNDTLGHEAGDNMLVNTAELLRQNFRSSDIIARIGGDEFTILLTETEPEVVEHMMQRLRQSVQDYNSRKPEIPLSLSMGHALGVGKTADMHAIFREADNRMYREKIQREGSARNAILQALLYSMQARDFDTEGHCDRLQDLAASLAYSLDPSQEFMNDLSLLARFHDLGKVGTPDRILFKPGPLTEDEWQQMRQHCEIGHRIASSVPDLEPIADYILKHHEHWDGQGYPLGLSGEAIPLPCRILAISDAYDAMTSDRPYRKAMTREEAIAELQRCAGTQFDPELVERFIWILGETDEVKNS